jgi:hypothetical protein
MNCATLILALALLPGCSWHFSKRGVSIKPPLPPKDAVVNLTVRSIGITVGQNRPRKRPN